MRRPSGTCSTTSWRARSASAGSSCTAARISAAACSKARASRFASSARSAASPRAAASAVPGRYPRGAAVRRRPRRRPAARPPRRLRRLRRGGLGRGVGRCRHPRCPGAPGRGPAPAGWRRCRRPWSPSEFGLVPPKGSPGAGGAAAERIGRREIVREAAALVVRRGVQQPHQQEEGHHRRDEIGIGDLPGAAMVPVAGRLLTLDDDGRTRVAPALALARHGPRAVCRVQTAAARLKAALMPLAPVGRGSGRPWCGQSAAGLGRAGPAGGALPRHRGWHRACDAKPPSP